jgi:AcrR family transcriptional regulator
MCVTEICAIPIDAERVFRSPCYRTGMPVPAKTAAKPKAWDRLDPEAKRARLLDVAADVFTECGLAAPMPAVAEAAGVGVGSLYRCYASKDDLIAAIVVRQMDAVRDEVRRAQDSPDPGEALRHTLEDLVEWQARNNLVRAALAATSDRVEVQAAVGDVTLAWQELIDRARKQGSLRTDATAGDVRLIFAATRAADELRPGGRERMFELLIDAILPAGS